MDPDPGSSWIRIQYGSGSTTLVKSICSFFTVLWVDSDPSKITLISLFYTTPKIPRCHASLSSIIIVVLCVGGGPGPWWGGVHHWAASCPLPAPPQLWCGSDALGTTRTRDTRQLRQVGSIPPSTCVTPAMMPRPRDHPYPRYSLTQTGRQYLALYLRHPSYDAAAMPSGPPAHCNDHFAKSELCKFLQNGWTNFVHFCHAESS